MNYLQQQEDQEDLVVVVSKEDDNNYISVEETFDYNLIIDLMLKWNIQQINIGSQDNPVSICSYFGKDELF